MHSKLALCVLLCALPFAANAQADQPLQTTVPPAWDSWIPQGTTAGVRLGTFGVGPELGYRPMGLFGVRADAGFMDFGENFHAGHINYIGNVHLETYGLTADVYPFQEALHISAGLRLNENDLRGHSDPNQSVSFSGVTIPSGTLGSVGGKVTFDKLSPYLGFGWNANITNHLAFTSDFGAMFNGNPKASLTGTGPALAIPGAAAALQSEQTQVQNAVNGYNIYPVLEVGFAYKF